MREFDPRQERLQNQGEGLTRRGFGPYSRRMSDEVGEGPPKIHREPSQIGPEEASRRLEYQRKLREESVRGGHIRPITPEEAVEALNAMFGGEERSIATPGGIPTKKEGQIQSYEELYEKVGAESQESYLGGMTKLINEGGTPTTANILDKMSKRISEADMPEKLEGLIEELGMWTRNIKSLNPEEYNQRKFDEKLAEVTATENLDEKRKKAKNLISEVRGFYPEVERPERDVYKLPDSQEELYEMIQKVETDKYKEGGEYELIDAEKNIHPENFLAWVRNRMFWFHDLNPDTEINPLGEVVVPRSYRPIALSEILFNDQYWRHRVNTEKIIGKDKDGKVVKEEIVENTENKKFNNLRDHLLYETWLYMTNHNYDTKYRFAMGIESKAPETLAEIYFQNVLTKDRNRLLKILKLPKIDSKQVEDLLSENGQKEQGSVGKGVRRAILAYYYLSEIVAENEDLKDDPEGNKNMFKKVLGKEGTDKFYKAVISEILTTKLKDDFKDEIGQLKELNNQIKIRNKGKRKGEQKENELKLSDLMEQNPAPFIAKLGKKVKDGDEKEIDWGKISGNKEEFGLKLFENVFKRKRGDLNIFNLPRTDWDIFKLVRKGITDAVQDMEDMREDDAKYAESWAFSMAYYTGISARNDVEAIGFDAWSKIMNSKSYRIKQVEGRSPSGEKDSLYAFRRVGINFWEGINVKNEGEHKYETPLLHVLQGGEGVDVNLGDSAGKTDMKNFDFTSNAQRQFSVDHIRNAFTVFHDLLERHTFSFENLVQVGPFGRLIVNKNEMDKIMKGIYHDLRYAFDLPGFEYNKEISGWWREERRDAKGNVIVDKNGKAITDLKFGKKKLKDLMFNEDITQELNMNKRDLITDVHSKGQMSRNVFAYLIAQELWSHRDPKSQFPPITYEYASLVRRLFREYPYEVREVVDKNGIRRVEKTADFFSKEEWEKIEEMGGAKINQIFKEELLREGALGAIGGAYKGFKVWLESIFRDLR